MIKARVIGGGGDPADGYVQLLCAVTLDAIMDARQKSIDHSRPALGYLNSANVRGLHELAGINLPPGEWDRERCLRFQPIRGRQP